MTSYTFFFSKITIRNSLIIKSFIFVKCSKFLITEVFTTEFDKKPILFISINTFRGEAEIPYAWYSRFLVPKPQKLEVQSITGFSCTGVLRTFLITLFRSETEFVAPACCNNLYLLKFHRCILKVSKNEQVKFFLFKIRRVGFLGYQLGLFGFLPKIKFFFLKNYFILTYRNLILFSNLLILSYFNFFQTFSSRSCKILTHSKSNTLFRFFNKKKKTLKPFFIKTQLKQQLFGFFKFIFVNLLEKIELFLNFYLKIFKLFIFLKHFFVKFLNLLP
jgi:hypothetical protein